jgi:hypothetical protein
MGRVGDAWRRCRHTAAALDQDRSSGRSERLQRCPSVLNQVLVGRDRYVIYFSEEVNAASYASPSKFFFSRIRSRPRLPPRGSSPWLWQPLRVRPRCSSRQGDPWGDLERAAQVCLASCCAARSAAGPTPQGERTTGSTSHSIHQWNDDYTPSVSSAGRQRSACRFAALAEERSIAPAAKRLLVSEPTVSRALLAEHEEGDGCPAPIHSQDAAGAASHANAEERSL